MSEGLTCPDYKLGYISVGSRDLTNRNQGLNHTHYIMCFAVQHGVFTQIGWQNNLLCTGPLTLTTPIPLVTSSLSPFSNLSGHHKVDR